MFTLIKKKMHLEFRAFSKLSSTHIYDVLRLRQQVFVIEQNCIYDDIDNSDQKALHLLLYDKNELAGYLRIFEPGVKFKDTTIGRIVVSKKFRGRDIGKKIINHGIELAFQQFPSSSIRIEAQNALSNYYSKYGFISEGEVYVVDGIDHIQMVLKYNA